jgi:pilus assembly protein TadC
MKKYAKPFYIFAALGILLCLIGLILILANVGKQFAITNLKPIVTMAVGFFLFIIGAIVLDFTVRIAWLRRLEQKLNALQTGDSSNNPNLP